MSSRRPLFHAIKRVDFYRKVPKDLTEATIAGAAVSLLAAACIATLVVLEVRSFLQVRTEHKLMVEDSRDGDLLRVNFDISFPRLSCEFASLDVTDVVGYTRFNLSKTITKQALDENQEFVPGRIIDHRHEVKHEEVHTHLDETHAVDLDEKTFPLFLKEHPVVFVNFFAPWCSWCQKLAPAWEKAAEIVHKKYADDPAPIRFAKVDCTRHREICSTNHIQGYPSMRVFRHGSDIKRGAVSRHNAYNGDRTVEALTKFADFLVTEESAMAATPTVKSPGCRLKGFVDVHKVPGAVFITARSVGGHSFDNSMMDMGHVVNKLEYGYPIADTRIVSKMFPSALEAKNMGRLNKKTFVSKKPHTTQEHYMQVVKTSIESKKLLGGKKLIETYQYTAHSHSFQSTDLPRATFRTASVAHCASQKHRLVFLGTPDVAALVLQQLHDACAHPTSSWEVSAVVSQPGTRSGRRTHLDAEDRA
eukprot:jgi/Pico_ML_1/55490/g1166.t1